MDNTEDLVPNDIKERFNTGYLYSKHYPELSERILSGNTPKTAEEQQVSVLLEGMRAYINSPERDRMKTLRDLRNPQEGEKEHEIER